MEKETVFGSNDFEEAKIVRSDELHQRFQDVDQEIESMERSLKALYGERDEIRKKLKVIVSAAGGAAILSISDAEDQAFIGSVEPGTDEDLVIRSVPFCPRFELKKKAPDGFTKETWWEKRRKCGNISAPETDV